MFGKNDHDKPWREGIYLCTAHDTFEADLFESKLASENIPCVKKYQGASNFIEIAMGSNSAYPIDIYVPEDKHEDALNVLAPISISDEDLEKEALAAAEPGKDGEEVSK